MGTGLMRGDGGERVNRGRRMRQSSERAARATASWLQRASRGVSGRGASGRARTCWAEREAVGRASCWAGQGGWAALATGPRAGASWVGLG